MKFQDLAYFYAVMSAHSDIPTTQNKRRMVKEQLHNILKDQDVLNSAKLLKSLLSDSAIRIFFGETDQKNVEFIRTLVDEIATNPQSIKDVIKAHKGEENSDSDIQYLDHQAQEMYPELYEHAVEMNEWQARIIHDDSAEKPTAPGLTPPTDGCFSWLNFNCFRRPSRKPEKQTLLDEEEGNCCRLW